MGRTIKINVLFAFALMVSLPAVAQDDVDTRIGVNEMRDSTTFVVVISNENYKYEQPVPYALNDGETFRLYCEKTLGVPTRNIRYTADATLNDMRMTLQWLSRVMKAYDGEARAIVYYSGHGMPKEDGTATCLLPVDGNSSLYESGMSVPQLYEQLAAMPSRATMVFLDACFSGARRDGKMLASSRGVAIFASEPEVKGNMVVFSAATGEETAYPYKEKQHGLFTYFLLKELQQQGGGMSLGKLVDEVTKQVKRESIVENDKMQTPTLIASESAGEWRKWMMARGKVKTYEQVNRTAPVVNAAEVYQLVQQPTLEELTEEPVVEETKGIASIKNTKRGQEFTLKGVSFKMVTVEGGLFDMGTDEHFEDDSDEKPMHKVQLESFSIGETEVTQKLWTAVMGDNPSSDKSDNLPVNMVSWEDCQTFIAKLNELTGMKFRLPTEAEWEYAARGGKNSKGYIYSGSNHVEDVAWYEANSKKKTYKVKSKLSNELGLYDMGGNVWEWCQDWYDSNYYAKSSDKNPGGPLSGTYKVARGGSWSSFGSRCRVTYRDFNLPTDVSASYGLRLAL